MLKVIGLVLLVLAAVSEAAKVDDEYAFLRDSMRVSMSPLMSDRAPEGQVLSGAGLAWLKEMSAILKRKVPTTAILNDDYVREIFLRSVFYESHRAGLDPQWVLAIIQIESGFRKYAVSVVGARGYMQIMPFWQDLIGERHHNLFMLRTNLRYGTVIFRHYLDIEGGNYYRALGRYNGSLGKTGYPESVYKAWQKNWAR